MRVLVVDDEKAVADSTILVFRQFGYEAEAVYSAEEALAAVQHLHPDLLVADVMMSGMNGIELAIRLCDEMPHCKTLLFSGQADTANLLEEARQRGFEFEILAKPVLPAELIDKAVQLAGEGRQRRA